MKLAGLALACFVAIVLCGYVSAASDQEDGLLESLGRFIGSTRFLPPKQARGVQETRNAMLNHLLLRVLLQSERGNEQRVYARGRTVRPARYWTFGNIDSGNRATDSPAGGTPLPSTLPGLSSPGATTTTVTMQPAGSPEPGSGRNQAVVTSIPGTPVDTESSDGNQSDLPECVLEWFGKLLNDVERHVDNIS